MLLVAPMEPADAIFAFVAQIALAVPLKTKLQGAVSPLFLKS